MEAEADSKVAAEEVVSLVAEVVSPEAEEDSEAEEVATD